MQVPPRFVLLLVFSVLTSLTARTAAREPPGQSQAFQLPASREFVLPRFVDREVSEFLATLDAMLLEPAAILDNDDAGRTLWSFTRRLQAGRLTPQQEATIAARLRTIGTRRPPYRDLTDKALFTMRHLTVGKTAPDVTGRDLDGVPIRLSDFRGKVVVLSFSAEWCGICRSQYPYFRLLQDLYKNWPFAMLSVETGSTRDAVRRAKADQHLTYRSFWDPPTATSEGAIADAWNVRGWPTLYVIDAGGVIRFVDLKDEDLLKAVRQLVNQEVERTAADGRKK